MIRGRRKGMDSSPQHRDHAHGDHAPVNGRVVVGIDGSDTSWDAFCWACGETRRLGGRTVAVFVGPIPAAASATTTASLPVQPLPTGTFNKR